MFFLFLWMKSFQSPSEAAQIISDHHYYHKPSILVRIPHQIAKLDRFSHSFSGKVRCLTLEVLRSHKLCAWSHLVQDASWMATGYTALNLTCNPRMSLEGKSSSGLFFFGNGHYSLGMSECSSVPDSSWFRTHCARLNWKELLEVLNYLVFPSKSELDMAIRLTSVNLAKGESGWWLSRWKWCLSITHSINIWYMMLNPDDIPVDL